MKLVLAVACCLAVRIAHAEPRAAADPPPSVVDVDVDLEKLDAEVDLVFTTREPLGLLVTADASAYWREIGCIAGDVIRRIDGAPVATVQRALKEGQHTVELLRAGKPLLLRVLVHGPQFRTVHLAQADLATSVGRVDKLSPGALALALAHDGGLHIVDDDEDGLELHPGDVVTAVGAARVTTETDLRVAIKNMAIGHTDVSLRRDGRALTVTWELDP